MVELKEKSPWTGLTSVGRGGGVVGAPVIGRAIATIMVGRGRIGALVERVQQSFGIVLRDESICSTADGLAFLGIGPGRWLVMADQPATDFVAGLLIMLDGLAAVIDQSSALAILKLSGPALPDTLEKGFQIDLRRFTVGECAVTSVHHLGATIWKVTDDSFEVAVARSLVGSFLHWLSASAGVDGLVFASD